MIGWVVDPQTKKKKFRLADLRSSDFQTFFLSMNCFVQKNFTLKHKRSRTEESKSALLKQGRGPQSPHFRPCSGPSYGKRIAQI